jgi:hypothetical protein
MAIVFDGFLTVLPLWGQNTNTGEIKGSVTDPSGAVIANATVTITDVLTGVVTKAGTNKSGIYDVPSLLPGEYTIAVTAPGFKDYLRKGVVLQVETIAINATLTWERHPSRWWSPRKRRCCRPSPPMRTSSSTRSRSWTRPRWAASGTTS